MSALVTAMDASLEPSGELELPTTKPFGHFVMHLHEVARNFCIVSEARGCLGYFEEPTLAQPFLRMLVRSALAGHGRLDFRLWRWNVEAAGWEVFQRTIPLAELRRCA